MAITEKKEELCNELVEIKEENGEKTREQTEKDNANKDDCKDQAKNILDDIKALAMLLNTSVDALKKEFYFTQITKIMAKMQKAVVRYDMTETELAKVFISASNYGLGGIIVSPAYLQNCVKQNKKNKTQIELCSIIDFPFGESSIKGKISDIKESFKMGATSVAVTMPTMMFNAESLKEFKKQIKTICRASKNRAGIVINASDVSEEKYAGALKILNKSKLCFITLAFGDATQEEVKTKLLALNKCGLSKRLFVIANVDRAESAVELYKHNVDSILTPYADEIGEDLLKRFSLI